MDISSLLKESGCYIDGKWSEGQGPELKSFNPANGELLATTPSSSASQVSDALASASHAFHSGEWSRLTAKDRGALIHRLTDLLERDREELTQLIATEVGSPISTGRAIQLGTPIDLFRYAAESAITGPKDGLEEMLPLHFNPVASESMLLREPIGVVGAIIAYNVPIFLAALKLGPALAAGCTAVLVPSPRALLSTTAFVKLIDEAGFPPGAVNYVFGSPSVTEQVASAPEVSMVSFTGSAAVGAKIMALAAPTLKKVVLELGGKSANIVLPGTNLDPVIAPSTLRFCINAGQRCGATTRALVHESDFDEFVDRTAAFMRSLVVGDPLREETQVGPLITQEHLRTVEGYVNRAKAEGANIVIGGGRPAGLEQGAFFEPTIVTGLSNSAEINQEELFAPVTTVIPYKDIDEAVEIANDSRYGLGGNIWGPTVESIAMARRLRTGTVTINGGGGRRNDAPWGGYGMSGIGRETGDEGYREFFEVKHVQWKL